MPSYFVTEETFLEATDWEEDYAEVQPGGGASFSRDSGESVVVGTIPFTKMRAARQAILGYAYADDSAPWALHRTVPWRHPDFPEQRADDVHFVGFNPMGKTGNPGNKPYVASAVPTEPMTRRTRYTRATATIRFKPHAYPFATDLQLAGASELYRNCAIFDTLDPSLELLLADSQPYFWFLEGTQSDGSTSLVGQNFPGTMPEYISKCLFVLGWFDVPLEFVANPYFPSKIMSCMGFLNYEDNWLGVFPKGTLLMEAPRIRKKQQPIWTVNDRIPFMVDIFFPFKYFDPPPGTLTPWVVSPPVPPANPIFRGWNLFPWGRSGKWYSVGRGETSGDATRPFLGFKTFTNMFTHVQSPAMP